MFVEYERLWVVGGAWIFSFAYTYWIYEDSQRHRTRAWTWILAIQLLGIPGAIISAYYDWLVLPGRGVHWYSIPAFAYDSSQFVEPVLVLDLYFLWGILSGAISYTLSFFILYWIYMDCKREGIRATPWIFGMQFVTSMPWPLSMVIPLGGFSGQVIILIGYTLGKLGYIKVARKK